MGKDHADHAPGEDIMKTKTHITRRATAAYIYHLRSTVMHTTTTIQTLSRILMVVSVGLALSVVLAVTPAHLLWAKEVALNAVDLQGGQHAAMIRGMSVDACPGPVEMTTGIVPAQARPSPR